ncbi:MAG: SIMPL domain-containing protein [Planctomycetes bacterium]|nr:SIMPL domain-containing protein [Planctomycetota bacterium]
MRFAVIFACLLTLPVNALPAAEGKEEQRTVAVGGTAVMRIVPDVVVWRITTTDNDKNLVAAKEQSDAKLTAILGLRETLGVKPEDVQTGYLSIKREFEGSTWTSRRTFKHFAVTRSVTIKERDLKRFDEFFTRLVSSGDVEVEVEFESSRHLELRNETRLLAIRAAESKAKAMTEALGAKVGRVLTIEEGEPAWPCEPCELNLVSTAPGAAPEDVASGTFAPGSIEVRVSVRVTFAIQ